MYLFTPEQYAKLIENGQPGNRGKDHYPVVKLFMDNELSLWLITELDPDCPDTAFGLYDWGYGYPELTHHSLWELEKSQNMHCLLYRDRSFVAKYPISVYTYAANEAWAITEDDVLLRQAYETLKL
ncbi:DUF2958 domain-containing protein [Pedobacter sp. HMF7056]|uniref:DUF2958 domain-containing protein n=1 Tax=Hufsiella ginkgonis TaxID=2695274 RepID=A0A7K1Y0X9_9SPHI|nr:DUF2958 domain-containing protein [Hufsiella ginkgonis]MXV16895.1 DUF2958 domain-containing protein [Hufsiella ginkgonis]